jgi:zinc protease
LSYRGDYRVRLGAILAAGLWLALGTAAHAADTGGAQALLEDPAIRRGVLANGLRYAIKSNPTPQGGLSLRLALDVGSMLETDQERGAAHFIEHMAFRDTRRFPEGELEPLFAPIGVGFGRDQNAFTFLDATLYLVDLPHDGPKERALAFRWLRDVADGIRFDPAAVDRERRVVLAERGARQDPNTLIAEALTAFQAPELLSSRRPPIGALQTIQAISGQSLEAFYRRWYRPERAIVVVVGDVQDLSALETEIAEVFGDWRPAGEAGQPPALAGPNLQRGPDALLLARPAVSPSIAICRLAPPTPKRGRGMAAARRQALREVWAEALHGRLTRLAVAEPTITLADPEIVSSPDATKVCVSAMLAGEDWERQLAALQGEIRSFSERDVTEDELGAAIQNVRSGLLGYVQAGLAPTSSAFASGLAYSLLGGEIVMEPREAMRVFNQAIAGLDPGGLRAAWKADWTGAGPLIAVIMPKPPPREAVLAAWERNQQTELAAQTPAVASTAQWAYGMFDAPGVVTKREAFAAPDFVRLRFANGVILNFKESQAAAGKAELLIDFGGGREELGPRHLDEAGLATDFFALGGLGRHSYVELESIVGQEPLRFELAVAAQSFELSTDAFVSRLQNQLLLIATFFRDPGFRADLDGKIPAIVAADYRAVDASPLAMALDALRATQTPGATLARTPEAQISALTSRDFAALLRGPVTTAPIEITLVGDLTEAEATTWVAQSFGTLPARTPRTGARSRANFQRFPEATPAPISVRHKGPAERAGLVMAWPTFVGAPERRREVAALNLLAAIFNDSARHAIRERLGKSYAPEVTLAAEVERADQGHIQALVESAPTDLPVVQAELRAVAASLAAGEITPQMLEAARGPLVAAAQANQTDIAWIAAYLSYSPREPDRPGRLIEAPRMLASLSLDEVKRAAATWLTAPPIIVTAIPETTK